MSSRCITDVTVKDIRFPTSLESHGSDAMHTDPDYSAAYVVITTSDDLVGYGISFTLGRGTDIIVAAIKVMTQSLVGKTTDEIYDNFGLFWRNLCNDSQMRWLGPEKGVIHLGAAGIINALWDLWGRIENKPVWKLLSDMTPEQIVSAIDFRHVTDALTPNEALEILRDAQSGKEKRERRLRESGIPAYTTAAGWLGYSDEILTKRCQMYLDKGFTRFKAKVGADLEDDKRRLGLLRKLIGPNNWLATDANQRWDVQEAIDWMKELKEYKIHWIEEPTSPDDILGHKAIAEGLADVGIKVATGEMAQNRIMFKQFLSSGAMHFCQIDSARVGGVNELLCIVLMAAKFKVPVCPHAGGVGLCEMVQHLSMWDYVAVSGENPERLIEYVDHLHEHFVYPVVEKNACYMPPLNPGYSTQIKEDTVSQYEYPDGSEWQRFFAEGVFKPSQ